MRDIFFYGSLRDPALLEVVLARPVGPEQLVTARAEGYAARRLIDEAYPMLLSADGSDAEGVLFLQATDADLDRLAFFQGAEYGLAAITVTCADGPRTASCFRGSDKAQPSTETWEFDTWCRQHRAVALEATREYMHHYGRLPVSEVDTIWPGIMIRAYQRVRAQASKPQLGALRTDFGPGDIDQTSLTRGYTSFLAVQELKLRHRRFDGGWTGALDRSVVAWGDAVTVLPYDPHRDRVLLIEQFRPGPLARGDSNPWCIEVIAGRVDAAETPEQTARREAIEEADLTLGNIVGIGDYYPTPGLACEQITAFTGQADLDGPGGLHGLHDEGEDIRAMVLGFDEAMAAIDAGAVNTAPALVSLLWLAANRERLRSEWGAE